MNFLRNEVRSSFPPMKANCRPPSISDLRRQCYQRASLGNSSKPARKMWQRVLEPRQARSRAIFLRNFRIMRHIRLAILLSTLTLASPSYAARGGVQQDGAVLAFDRRQRGTFNKSFEQYVSTRVGPGRINGGRAMLQRHAALLSSIEAKFGVPRQILVAIWGLETDFGKGDMGKLPVFRVLATMAHDCRRTELFQGELLSALKIVQRGDLRLGDMIGAYAGEIGQTQFLPSSYIKYGVDFDGDGHVDLRHSVPDVLASTANLLHTNGFKMGAPYGEGSANFEAMREWNRATIYRKTIRYFADRLVGR